jgi:hypothetical protein
MFFNFLDELRSAGIPASLKEHLILLERAIWQPSKNFDFSPPPTCMTDK